jgi:transcription initiation factor IIE alpha subunit
MPSIPCPKCKTKIEFDFNDIMNGEQFICSTCNIKITLSYEDNKTTLLKAKEKLNELKDELGID